MHASDNSTKTGGGDGTSGTRVAPSSANPGYVTNQLGAQVNNSGTASSCQVSTQAMSQVLQAPKTQNGPALVSGVSSVASKSVDGSGSDKNLKQNFKPPNKAGVRTGLGFKRHNRRVSSSSDDYSDYSDSDALTKTQKPMTTQKQPAQQSQQQQPTAKTTAQSQQPTASKTVQSQQQPTAKTTVQVTAATKPAVSQLQKPQSPAVTTKTGKQSKKTAKTNNPGCANPGCQRTSCGGKCTPPSTSSGVNGHTKSKNVKRAGGKGNHHNKNAGLAQTIKQDLNVYNFTRIYSEAVKKTFANKAALDNFNAWVIANRNSIDPAAMVACVDCGHSDLTLCDCWITAAPNAVTVLPGAVLAVPTGAVNIRWRFMWVDTVKRMFAWPSYNPDLPINHYTGHMTNAHIPEDDMLLEDMLCYIRQNLNTSYSINGVKDRSAKLAHSKKLAIRFLDERKVPLGERLTSRFVASMHLTVQKACDQPDDDFLLAENDENYNSFSLSVFRKAPVRPVLILGAAILCPILLSRVHVAWMKGVTWGLKRLVTSLTRTLVHGSVSTFGLIPHTIHQLGIAIKDITLSGVLMPCYIAIQPLLCNIARTMSSVASRTGISNLLQNPRIVLTFSSMVVNTLKIYVTELFRQAPQLTLDQMSFPETLILYPGSSNVMHCWCA